MSIDFMMLSSHLILCLSILLLPSIFPSIRVFSSESALCIKWPKYWSFSFSNNSFNKYSGLIFFRIDWFDLLAVKDSQESFPTLQFKNISSFVLRLLFGSILTSIHDYWKNQSFDIQTFVNKVRSLPFNILSRFVIDFLPRSKCLLISWLPSLSSVILEPKKIKSVTASTFSPSICHEVMGLDAMILGFSFLMLSFKPAFSLSSFSLLKRLFSSLCFLPLGWRYHLYI